MIKNIDDNNTKNKSDLINTYRNQYPFIQNKNPSKPTQITYKN